MPLCQRRNHMNSLSALVTAAGGIGDILRVTPLVRVFAMLGYEVDVLISPDYLDTRWLLEGAPEIRSLFNVSRRTSNEKQIGTAGLRDRSYDVATFTLWSAPLERLVATKRILRFEQRQWIQEGDISCVTRIARTVGWHEPLPEPFAVTSGKRFGLPPGTVALHPGCKQGWPWKKWHGYEELARLLKSVVVLGTASDLDNGATYFRRPFEWPDHVQNFAGELSLHDTAALLSECAALVSNDSGLMHLGVALGVPTFGIFGLTSPAREAIPLDTMNPITKGLACEPACRRQPWGRRDCLYHLECMKSLSAEEVLRRVEGVVRLKEEPFERGSRRVDRG